jgi:uncharacterized RDD family membrane protein YckC
VAKLILNPTSSSRREVPLARTLLSIGRDPSNDVVLPDALVSRRHAVIEYRGDQYVLRDCNSSNGSLVNGDRVSEHPLKDGDLLAIGTSRFLFRATVDVEDAAAKVVAHPSSPRLQCPGCRADYRRGDQFCRHCGKALPPPAPLHATCPSCSADVPLPAKFCTTCGTVLPRPDGLEPTQPRPIPPSAGDVVIPTAAPAAAPAPSAEKAAPADPLPELPEVEMRSVPKPSSGSAQAALSRPVLQLRPSPPPPAPIVTRRPADPVAHIAPTALPPGELGPRLLAWFIDMVLVSATQAILVTPAVYYFYRDVRTTGPEPAFLPILLSVTLVTIAVVLGAGYYVYFWGVKGATLGKRMMNLSVQTIDGVAPIGVGRAFLRLLGYVLSGALFGLGFVMVAFGGLGLHDRLASTRVVRTRPIA